MEINKRGLELVKEFEGCRLTAYLDPVGIWTIGFGNTSHAKEGLTITKREAEEWLKEDLKAAENAVSKWQAHYSFNENEASALISFTFNCGAGSLNNLVKNGKRTKAEITRYITLYNKGINGKVLPGLTRRRKAEKELFLLPVEPAEETQSDPSTAEVYDVAVRVCRGEFGDNADRVAALKSAGYDPATIQKEVNRIFKHGFILGQTYTVKVLTWLNIRSGAGFNFPVKGKLDNGAKVKAEEIIKDSQGNIWIREGSTTVCAHSGINTYLFL